MQTENKNSLKIISLGGFGQVTNNMFVYETQDEILIVDCGLGFPTGEMPGVDLTIPDVSYLLPKKKKIKGIVLSHGHDDHIGALPYILPQLGQIPIFGSRWALALAKGKLKEFNLKASLEEMKQGKTISLGKFEIQSIEVTHSIPETLHLVISTPLGIFYHAADFKLDLSPAMGKPTDQTLIRQFGEKGVLCLLSDCLRSEKEGFTPSETKLEEMFEREISTCRGKFFVTTMSSNISRLKQAIEVSLRRGRKIVLVGRSVDENVKLALEMGYLKFPRDVFLPPRNLSRFSPSSLTLLVAGSQAQAGSALEKIVGQEHEVKINPSDKVVFSTDCIPGNETAIYSLIDNIYRLGAEVSYVDIQSDVHVSGHGQAGDLKKLIELVRPKYLLPIGGNFRHAVAYQRIAVDLGYRPNDVLLAPQSQTFEFLPNGQAITGKPIVTKTVMVDALGIGDVGNVVLRDRQTLAKEGIVVAIVQVDLQRHELIAEPEIVTRGFVYVHQAKRLLEEAKKEIAQVIARQKVAEIRLLRGDLQEMLEKFFFSRTGRQPMVLPVIISV